MDDSEFPGFHIKIQKSSGIYEVSVWRSGEGFELEEPSAKESRYYREACKLMPRQYDGDRFQSYHIVSLGWTMVRPVLEVVSQEIEQVTAEAIERLLEYEQERQAELM
ncbi:MAG: hypothetical protein ACLPY1_23355 [Terracidiphilus sp.]